MPSASPLPDSTLTEQDVRTIVRLLGQVIAAPGDIHAKRRILMDGLCRIIDATAWIWCMAEFDPDKPPSFIGLVHSGCDDERFTRYLEAMNQPAMEPVTRPSSLELQAKGSHLTRTQRQMDPDFLLLFFLTLAVSFVGSLLQRDDRQGLRRKPPPPTASNE